MEDIGTRGRTRVDSNGRDKCLARYMAAATAAAASGVRKYLGIDMWKSVFELGPKFGV